MRNLCYPRTISPPLPPTTHNSTAPTTTTTTTVNYHTRSALEPRTPWPRLGALEWGRYSSISYNPQHAFHQPKSRFYFLWALHLIKLTYAVFVFIHYILGYYFVYLPIITASLYYYISIYYAIRLCYVYGSQTMGHILYRMRRDRLL